MANFNNQPNKTSAGTNIQQVRQQNAQSAQGGAAHMVLNLRAKQMLNKLDNKMHNLLKSSQSAQGAFGTEFASETNAAEVRQQNQQSQARKSQNSGQFGQS